MSVVAFPAHSLADLVGIPYRDRGRGINGADCWGIVVLYHQYILDQRIPDYLGLYCSAEDGEQAALAFTLGRTSWRQVALDGCQAGDVVLFRVMGYPSHCGVMLGREQDFLHTLRGRNSTIEGVHDIAWRDRLEGVWRWTS